MTLVNKALVDLLTKRDIENMKRKNPYREKYPNIELMKSFKEEFSFKEVLRVINNNKETFDLYCQISSELEINKKILKYYMEEIKDNDTYLFVADLLQGEKCCLEDLINFPEELKKTLFFDIFTEKEVKTFGEENILSLVKFYTSHKLEMYCGREILASSVKNREVVAELDKYRLRFE